MPALHIPGFYYDEAKGKYFRRQPFHFATPALPKPLRTPTRYAGKMKQLKPIRPSQIFGNPLVGHCGLQRELGINRFQNFPAYRGTAWAHGLERTQQISDEVRVFCYDYPRNLYHCSKRYLDRQWLTSFPRHESGNGRGLHLDDLKGEDIFGMELTSNRTLVILSAELQNPEPGGRHVSAKVRLMSLRENKSDDEDGDGADDALVTNVATFSMLPGDILWVSVGSLTNGVLSQAELFANVNTTIGCFGESTYSKRSLCHCSQ